MLYEVITLNVKWFLDGLPMILGDFIMNYKRTLIVMAMALLSFPVFCAGNVFAQGRMIINPHIETGARRDTNFHKSEENTKTVDTYYIKPGVELGYTTDKTTNTLDYWLNWLNYDDQDDISAGERAADVVYLRIMYAIRSYYDAKV